MSNPLVSILITTRNVEDYISTALDSVLAQTSKDFEVIIIDESEDKTREIIDSYVKKDKRIKVFDQKTKGRVEALNEGLEYCSGEYIAILDADDYWLPDKIKKQVDFLEKNKEYVLVGTWRKEKFIDGHEGILKLPTQDKDIRKALMKYCVIGHSSILIRGDILRRYKYDNKFKISEDYEMYMRVAEKHKLANLGEVLTIYVHRKDSITRSRSKLETLKFQMRIRIRGLSNPGVPVYYFIYIFKPFVQFVVPNSLIEKYASWRLRKSG